MGKNDSQPARIKPLPLSARHDSINSVSSAPSPLTGKRKISKERKMSDYRDQRRSQRPSLATIVDSDDNDSDDQDGGNICIFLIQIRIFIFRKQWCSTKSIT